MIIMQNRHWEVIKIHKGSSIRFSASFVELFINFYWNVCFNLTVLRYVCRSPWLQYSTTSMGLVTSIVQHPIIETMFWWCPADFIIDISWRKFLTSSPLGLSDFIFINVDVSIIVLIIKITASLDGFSPLTSSILLMTYMKKNRHQSKWGEMIRKRHQCKFFRKSFFLA